jgi:hypothetical protein
VPKDVAISEPPVMLKALLTESPSQIAFEFASIEVAVRVPPEKLLLAPLRKIAGVPTTLRVPPDISNVPSPLPPTTIP